MAAARKRATRGPAKRVRRTSSSDPRTARVERKTRETEITLALNLDGQGRSRIKTGVGFLDHMLTSLATHSRIDLDVRCKGDLHVDAHHSVEDVGIAFGQALRQATGDKQGLVRFGHAYVPLDEALSRAVVDLSGRPWLHFGVQFKVQRIGDMPTELFEDFFWALVDHGRFNLHLDVLRGPQQPPHRRDAVQGDGARARDGGGPRPARGGRAVHEGEPVIAIVDYGIGNLGSVTKGFRRAGAEVELTGDPDVAAAGRRAGAARRRRLRRHDGRDREPRARCRCCARPSARGTPLLGICIGMQLLFEESEEHGRHRGLGILPGRVRRFDGDAAGAAHGLEHAPRAPRRIRCSTASPTGRTSTSSTPTTATRRTTW